MILSAFCVDQARNLAGLASLALVLAGCERAFVGTEAVYSKVDAACVDRAIRNAPGVTGVTHKHKREGKALSHIWSYQSDEPAYITLTEENGSWIYSANAMTWAAPWSGDDLANASPEMAAIHLSIERRCGMTLPDNIGLTRD